MKFEFTEEHEALRGLVVDLCKQEADPRVVYDTDATIDERLWAGLRSAGLLGVGSPEDFEGGGAGPVEQLLIAEHLGRAVAAVPFSEHTAAAETIMVLGSDAQRREHLPPLNRGDVVAGVSLPCRAELAARSDGATWRLDGRIPLIPNAASAGVLVVPALVEGNRRWFVTGKADIIALPTVDRSRPAAAAELDGADADLLEGTGSGARGGRLALALAAAEAAGAAANALERTAQYTTERHQFGLPIGTFQAVKHRLADMLVAVENSLSSVYGAAWTMAEGGQEDRSVHLAQAVATANAVSVISDAVQLHGGIGVTWECDLHLALRRAKALEATYGSPAHHRARIADALLD